MPTGIYKRPENYKGNLGTGFLGKKHTEETKHKLSKSHFGKKLSKVHRNKLSKAHKGKKMHPKTKEALIRANTGNKYTLGMTGEKCGAWKGGVTLKNHLIRGSTNSLNWRKSVFTRDDWTCRKCKIRGGKLHPHHIQNFSSFPKLRFSIKNGITLCIKDHKLFHHIYGTKNNTRKQITEFLKYG